MTLPAGSENVIVRERPGALTMRSRAALGRALRSLRSASDAGTPKETLPIALRLSTRRRRPVPAAVA